MIVDVDGEITLVRSSAAFAHASQRQAHPLLNRPAELIQRERVHERLLAHQPVLAVVRSVAARDSLVFDDVPEGVGEHAQPVVLGVCVADVFHDVGIGTVLTHMGPTAFLMPTVSWPVMFTHSSIASGMPTGEDPALSKDLKKAFDGSITGPPSGILDFLIRCPGTAATTRTGTFAAV